MRGYTYSYRCPRRHAPGRCEPETPRSGQEWAVLSGEDHTYPTCPILHTYAMVAAVHAFCMHTACCVFVFLMPHVVRMANAALPRTSCLAPHVLMHAHCMHAADVGCHIGQPMPASLCSLSGLHPGGRLQRLLSRAAVYLVMITPSGVLTDPGPMSLLPGTTTTQRHEMPEHPAAPGDGDHGSTGTLRTT